MKKLFLDTNIIIDIIVRKYDDNIGTQLLVEAEKRKMTFYISFLTVANFAYIHRKMTMNELTNHIRLICETFHIIPNDKTQLLQAVSLNPKDYEDAVQYATAVSAGCDCILTRNAKDFPFATIPVLSPQEFLATLTD